MSDKNKKKGMGIVIPTVLSVAIFGAGLALNLNATGRSTGIDSTSKENSIESAKQGSFEETDIVEETAQESASIEISEEKVAESVPTQEEQGIPYWEDFYQSSSDGMYNYESDNDYAFFHGNTIMAPFATKYINGEQVFEYPNILEGKNVRRYESRNCNYYLFDLEGSYYTFSGYSDGFREVDKKAVNPCMADGSDIAYIVPTNNDQTVGDLYLQSGILDSELRFIANDVVASSNGVIYEDAFDGFDFYFLKCDNGRYSLNKAWIDNHLDHSNADPKWEKELFEGKNMPLFCTKYSLYYYDLDNKDMYYVDYYYNKEGDIEKFYTGDFDEYYGFHSGGFLFTKGDDVYYYVKRNTEKNQEEKSNLILTTGIQKIVYRGEVSDYGYNGGHKIQSNLTYCIIYDKNGDEYCLGYDSKTDSYKTVKLNHRIEDKNVTYFNSACFMYLEDGVVYVESPDFSMENGFSTSIKFDKEEAIDYCCDYSCENFFVYTKAGNLYYYDQDNEEYKFIDSGLDPDKDGTGCNFVWDIQEEKLVYGKDDKMYSYDPEYDSIKEKDSTYFYFSYEDSIVYCYYKDSDKKYIYHRGRAYEIF